MYKIIFSEISKNDLNNISDIIFRFTFSKNITDNIYQKIITKIYSLQLFPYICTSYKEYRIMLINKKYKVFYKVDENKKIIKIYRILFSSSNYQEII